MAETIRLTVQEQNQQVPMSVEQVRIIEAISPEALVERVEGGAEFTVTDYRGTTSVVINDGEPGEPGEPGQPGQPGVSPTVTVTDITGGHRITVTDATGPHSFDVMDGEPGDPGDPTELIDDTSTTAEDRTWSAKHLNNKISEKYTKPQTGIPATDLASGVIPSVPVQDVQIDGISILDNGVANVPVASSSALGAVKVGTGGYGIIVNGTDKDIRVSRPADDQVKAGTQQYRPIVPYNQHKSVYYALAKLAGADMASLSGETVGVYPEAQKIAIQKMLGIYQAQWELIREDTVTNATETNIEIVVDGNGNAFELTDAIVEFDLPKNSETASIGSYGTIQAFISNSLYLSIFMGAKTRAAGANAIIGYAIFRREKGMLISECVAMDSQGSMGTVQRKNTTSYDRSSPYYLDNNSTITKIVILSVTGTGHYRLYGKRKWQ